MIEARVKAGLERAKQEQMAGKVRRDARAGASEAIGRPRATEAAIRECWRRSESVVFCRRIRTRHSSGIGGARDVAARVMLATATMCTSRRS